jgi:predicted lysophospholipase L1 biosynthesis ABC-type transport system permease subunit
VGISAIFYALLYPHFLGESSPWLYLIAAPVGIVPCPSLSMVLGFTLLFNGFHSRLWQTVCVAAGVFYAIFGLFILGVWIDIGLLLVSISILALMSERQELAFGP